MSPCRASLSVPFLLGSLAAASAAQVGLTTLVSVSSSGHQAQLGAWTTAISPDGRYVAFETHSADLDPAATALVSQVYLHDRVTGELKLVSVTPASLGGSKGSFIPSVSEGGLFVAFVSWGDDLAPGDANGLPDVLVRDTAAGTTSLVSVSSSGTQGDGLPGDCSISGDGRYVAFDSEATNLVPSDGNGEADVFLRDRLTGETIRVSVASDGTEADGESRNPAISLDGQHVAFASTASNLTPFTTNGGWNVYVHDVATGLTQRASVPMDGGDLELQADNQGLSADGELVVFESFSSKLVPGDLNGTKDVFVFERATGTTTRVSVSSSGVEGNGLSGSPFVNNFRDEHTLSADGRFVVFQSEATNLVPNDTNVRDDIFVHDRETGLTTRASLDSSFGQADGHSDEPSISANGRWISFESGANDLVDDDATGSASGASDAYVRDRGPWIDLGSALPGVSGPPQLLAEGWLEAGTSAGLALRQAAPLAPALLLGALDGTPAPFKGGTLQAFPPSFQLPAVTSASGAVPLSLIWPPAIPAGIDLRLQWLIADPAAVKGAALSQALEAVTP